ncbi:hypothetical protein GCM10028833_12620 [Glycomyces tarimensis]
MSLTPEAAGSGRGLPRQDRSAPPRRSARHIAADEPTPEDAAVQRGRRARREPVNSFFSIEEPPPLDAPPGITEITGWELAAAMWRDHLPEQLLGVECASCGQAWPCDAWEIADDLLTQCCEGAHQTSVEPA